MSEGRRVFIATQTFSANLDGAPHAIHRNVTRVREGHPLLDMYPGFFEAADDKVHFEVETTEAVPGEGRGAASGGKQGGKQQRETTSTRG